MIYLNGIYLLVECCDLGCDRIDLVHFVLYLIVHIDLESLEGCGHIIEIFGKALALR